MSWVKQLIDFLRDNINLIKANPWTFLTLLILCIGICWAVIAFREKKLKEKIDSLEKEITSLKNQLSEKQKKYEELKSSLQGAVHTKLIMGLNSGERSTSAENVSKHISEKYNPEKNE